MEDKKEWWQSGLEMVGSGLTGVLSGVTNWLTGREEQDRARQMNREQWEREVEINKPITKKKWLEDAQMNAALAYGGVSNMSGMAHVEPVKPDMQLGDIGKFAQVRNLDAQNAALVANTKVSDEQARKIKAEADVEEARASHIRWLSQQVGHPVSGQEPMPVGVLNETVAKLASPRDFWGNVADNFGRKQAEAKARMDAAERKRHREALRAYPESYRERQ